MLPKSEPHCSIPGIACIKVAALSKVFLLDFLLLSTKNMTTDYFFQSFT